MRAETGPLKFGKDWTGVFIRGDNAIVGFAPTIERVLREMRKLQEAEPAPYRSIDVRILEQLLDLLLSAQDGLDPATQRVGDFAEVKLPLSNE